MAPQPNRSKPLHIALWIVQAFLALTFIGGGIFKLITPLTTLTGIWPWTGEYPNLLRLTGFLDLCGGLGLVLPALTRIRPGLVVVAALGCGLLMVSAIVFHLIRGEGNDIPINVVLLVPILFVLWGRWQKTPIST